jgi:hypothetical protein
MDDKEREMWVMNDEEIYNWWQATGQGVTTFIRQNRKELTELILRKLNQEPLS